MAELPPAWAATAARKKARFHEAWTDSITISRNGGLRIPLKPDLDVMLNSVIKATVGEGANVEDWPVSQLRAAIKANSLR